MRVPHDLALQVRRSAEAEERSMSGVVRHALRQAFEREELVELSAGQEQDGDQ